MQALLQFPDGDRAPWDRLPRETVKQFHGFQHYRDLRSAQRTLHTAWQTHKRVCEGIEAQTWNGKGPQRWRLWSRTHAWLDRVSAWDRHVCRRSRKTA